jgi:hypothetical protein
MVALGFGGAEAFRLSAMPGAGALKLHKGNITLRSIDGATDAIVGSREGLGYRGYFGHNFVVGLTCQS